MAGLNVPISVDQLLELARQLSPRERREMLDRLLAERFDEAMVEADRARGGDAPVSDSEIQSEVDAVRRQRREERRRAAGD